MKLKMTRVLTKSTIFMDRHIVGGTVFHRHKFIFLFSDTLILGNIISEESNQDPVIGDDEGEENIAGEENVVGADKFVLEVLRTCHHIKSLSLHMHEISDRTGKNHKKRQMHNSR